MKNPKNRNKKTAAFLLALALAQPQAAWARAR
jgi:hypothetical protein